MLAAALLAPGWALAGSDAAKTAQAPRAGESRAAIADTVIDQSGDCYAIGERVAAQNGGTLGRATASTQGGQQVCVIVVLVPAKGGQHPRRVEIVVPQT